jgi:TRAP transporter 4TM/12TM fusion protein
MMTKRGFRPIFAGAVEAAASSGGQIMPPVMGIAAFLLASLTGVGYASVVLAALIPAICYFASLFVTVTIESRRQGIEAVNDLSPDMELDRQDWINLAIILLPIMTIVATLVLTANERAAGFWAVCTVIAVSFVDPSIRKAPLKLVEALIKGGSMVSQVFLLFMAVTLVDVSLNITGFSVDFKNSVLGLIDNLRSFDIFGTTVVLPSSLYLFVCLVLGMLAAILLGMGMPTLPAYANVALFMAPVLGALGTSLFTAHMFVFYFAVASAITPPVAIAGFAAATITKTEPMATSFEAVKVGALMLIVPFIFAFHPELLLIDDAFLAANGSPIGSHPDGFTTLNFLWIVARLPLVLYLIASCLVGYDRGPLKRWEIVLRAALAVGCLAYTPIVVLASIALALFVIWRHWQVAGPQEKAQVS